MTIGLVMPVISNPYLGGLLQSLQAETERRGYSLIVADTHDDPAHELRAVQGLVHLQVDGIVLAPSAHADEALSLLSLRGVPTTLLDRLPEAPLDGVGTKNVAAAAGLTTHPAVPYAGHDLASADCGSGQLAGGDRLRGPGRQMPVEAGAGDAGLGDDLGDGVPGGA